MKHMVINNNLYIVTEQCSESLKSKMQRSMMSHNSMSRAQEFLDPLDAMNA